MNEEVVPVWLLNKLLDGKADAVVEVGGWDGEIAPKVGFAIIMDARNGFGLPVI